VEIVAYGPGLNMLRSESKVVPGGVIHIMQRQREGWNYIRP
jgi:intracellular sulfur oxidation DsrE/DsrF family protein